MRKPGCHALGAWVGDGAHSELVGPGPADRLCDSLSLHVMCAALPHKSAEARAPSSPVCSLSNGSQGLTGVAEQSRRSTLTLEGPAPAAPDYFWPGPWRGLRKPGWDSTANQIPVGVGRGAG